MRARPSKEEGKRKRDPDNWKKICMKVANLMCEFFFKKEKKTLMFCCERSQKGTVLPVVANTVTNFLHSKREKMFDQF